MSVPELIRYVRTDLIAFTRHSDYEPEPTLLDRAAGVWLDCFDIPWVAPADILETLRHGKNAAIVSPELHGRQHVEFWTLLRALMASGEAAGLEQRLLLCTDYPDEAKTFSRMLRRYDQSGAVRYGRRPDRRA